MIQDLELALALHRRTRSSEFVVSLSVFLEVLRKRSTEREEERVVLNSPYDSPQFRWLNSARWQGMLFIHLSNQVISWDLADTSVRS